MPGKNRTKLFDMGIMLYSAFLKEKPLIKVPNNYVKVAQAVVQRVGWKSEVRGVNYQFTIGDIKENKKVMIGLSGGVDSVYFMHRLIDDGYDVTAVYVDKVNRTVARAELKQARKIAKDAKVPFFNIKMNFPKQTFPENPFKNQLILSVMLDLGVKKGIYRYALGCDWTSHLETSVRGYTESDTMEVNKYFWEGVKKHFPQAELIFLNEEEKKYKRYDYLYKNHYNSLLNLSSCTMPQRFRDTFHKRNKKKYKIDLWQGRCGSCKKCAYEYIFLVETKHIKKNEKFYDHCWELLDRVKITAHPEHYDARLPLEKRLENLFNLGS